MNRGTSKRVHCQRAAAAAECQRRRVAARAAAAATAAATAATTDLCDQARRACGGVDSGTRVLLSKQPQMAQVLSGSEARVFLPTSPEAPGMLAVPLYAETQRQERRTADEKQERSACPHTSLSSWV